MDEKENQKEKKEVENEKEILKVSLSLSEEKYLIRIYPSKDNITIVFKLEKEKAQTFYYFEKFDLRDFRQANKIFLSDKNIREVFIHLKDVTENSLISLEKKQMKMNISFKYRNEIKSLIKFTLRKKIVSQDRLNPMIVSQIQENKTKIQTLKNQIIKLDNLLDTKNDVITNIKTNITNINNIINNININNINSSNNSNTSNSTTKNSSSNESNSENNNNTNDDEDEENLKEEDYYKYQQRKESEGKMSSKKRRKKNKNKYKKMKSDKSENNNNNTNTNNNESLFCVEGMEIFQNKKVIELLFILNIVTIIMVMYILGCIYSLKTKLEISQIREEDFFDKLAYFSIMDPPNDEDENVNIRDMVRENILDMQLKKKDDESITSSKPKEEFMYDKKRNFQDRKKRNNQL